MIESLLESIEHCLEWAARHHTHQKALEEEALNVWWVKMQRNPQPVLDMGQGVIRVAMSTPLFSVWDDYKFAHHPGMRGKIKYELRRKISEIYSVVSRESR